jgi:hypothetical protein
MASTYVNNLRLEEIGSGEQSGSWGDTTNTNLEIIGQAVAWGTRAIANASTDNITIADGALDADRCLGLKLTGGGQACTVTLLPNTSSKTWFMYNATSYTLTFTCGSGANVAILAGETKVIATDGLGSGGVVHDLLTGVNLAGTTKVDDLVVGDDATVTDDLIVGGDIDLEGSIDVNGTANLDVVDIDGAVDMASTLTVAGVLTGASLDISGDIDVDGTANLDIVDIDGAVNMATTALITGILTTTAATVFNGGFASNADSTVGTDKKIQFRDAAIHISSSTDGQLDIVADTEIQIAATTIDINGAINASGEIIAASLDISGNADIDGTLETDGLTVGGVAAKVAGKESIWVPAAAMYPSTTNPCSDITQVETTALRPDLKVLDFAAAADDFAQFAIAFPKSWNEGTITYQPFWTVTGTNTGTMVWQLGGIAVSSDDTINTAFGTLVATTALAHSGTSNDLMVSAESGAVTIAGSPAANDMCFFQINNDASASGQTGVARLLGIKLFFTTDAANDA